MFVRMRDMTFLYGDAGEGPCPEPCEGLAPLCPPKVGAFGLRSKPSDLPPAPTRRALRPSTPGDFPVAGKVTKGAPGAAVPGPCRCMVTALFALAYASRRATFCHKNRPICHFEQVSKPVFVSPQATPGVTLSIFNPWLGRDGPEDAAGLFTLNQYR